MKTIIAFAVAAAFAAPALSQDKPKPPPAWHQGKPAAQAESKLAPHAGKMTETPASEIPIDKLKLPAGFKAELWASGLPGGRAMAASEDGKKIYVGTRVIGRVYEVTDEGSKRTVRVVVDKLTQPAGVAYKDGALYVFAIDKVLRFDGIAKGGDVKPVDLTAKFELPPEQHHNWKYVAFGPDGKLYVPFGAPCNICEPPSKEYAQIRRYNADGSGKEVIATGVRNSVGFDWHPKTKEMWFTDHGRDWAGDDGPQDELNRLAKPGGNYGFPYCHANGIVDPDIKKQDACKGVTRPVALMGPHAAVMGVKFYTGKMFPLGVPEHDVHRAQGLVEPRQADRLRRGQRARRRGRQGDLQAVRHRLPAGRRGLQLLGPPGLRAVMADGALLLSDEQTGAIYRISYQRPKAAAKKEAAK